MDKLPKDEFLVTMSTETDVLEVLIHFVKNTEYSDQDLSLYMEHVEDVKLELNGLKEQPGRHTQRMLTRLLTGDLSMWHDENVDEQDMKFWHEESIGLFQRFWDERFGESGVLLMFNFFSISLFRKSVSNIDEAQNFGKERRLTVVIN